MSIIDPRYLYLILPMVLGIILVIIVLGGVKLERKNLKLKRKEDMYTQRRNEIEAYRGDIKALISDIMEKLDDRTELHSLQERCEDYLGEFRGADPVLDALIAQKKKLCQSENVNFSINMSVLPADLLSEQEKVGLIGNLLDNAIEAADRSSEKWVAVESREVKGQWIFVVKNSKSVHENPTENRMATIKDDESRHGIGFKIVRRIVSAKNGYIKLRDKADSFEVFVALPTKGGKR